MLVPMKRIGTAEEVASLVLFLIGCAKQTRLAGIPTGAPSDFDRHAPHVGE
jgi:hypothetical protein